MGERTAIAWTEATWNPWMGCEKVSSGCDHCYMFTEQTRYGHDPNVVRRSKTKFAEPLRWKEPRKIFTCSWSDWFHKDADQWRDEAWDVIRRTPQHTYQILTKRPARIARHLPADWRDGYPNVWLGASVESQEWTNRIPPLLRVPARVRFLSCEPLLGPVDLQSVPFRGDTNYYLNVLSGRYSELPNVGPSGGSPFGFGLASLERIHWVIVGGESGANCRPMEEEWARTLRDQCADAGVAFFLKQLGGCPDSRAHVKAVLDGQTYTEMP